MTNSDHRGAILSVCERFRYRLWRKWGDGGKGSLVFLMLNPSTADAMQEDPTVRKCMGFANRNGYKGIEIINLFAFRTPKPSMLRTEGYVIGVENDRHIKAVLSSNADVVLAWGRHPFPSERLRQVRRLILKLNESDSHVEHLGHGNHFWTLGMNKGGTPAHPLMLGYQNKMERKNEDEVNAIFRFTWPDDAL